MTLKPTQTGRALIDIAATLVKIRILIPALLPAHALGRCDTVPTCHGIGKTKMLKAVLSG